MTTNEEVSLIRTAHERGFECACTIKLAVLLREDSASGITTKISLRQAIDKAKAMLKEDDRLHECE